MSVPPEDFPKPVERKLREAPLIPVPMICETCHRRENDPVLLDFEICGVCGDTLSAVDVDLLREDQDERERLYRETPDTE